MIKCINFLYKLHRFVGLLHRSLQALLYSLIIVSLSFQYFFTLFQPHYYSNYSDESITYEGRLIALFYLPPTCSIFILISICHLSSSGGVTFLMGQK